MKKYAKAIKAGYLECGDLFCRKGEIYTYTEISYGKYPIRMEDLVSKDHQMGRVFFDEYFIDVIEDNFLDEKDFEI